MHGHLNAKFRNQGFFLNPVSQISVENEAHVQCLC